jgi:hypothetical protein
VQTSKQLVAVALVALVACGGGTGNNNQNCPSSQPGCPGYVAPVNKPVISSFTASPSSLPAGGGQVTLSWSVSGASSVDLSSNSSALPTQSGLSPTSSKVATLGGTVTFTLSASNAGGTSTETLTVAVAQATDYGQQFVGTYTGVWGYATSSGFSQQGTVSSFVVTEPSLNQLNVSEVFSTPDTVNCSGSVLGNARPANAQELSNGWPAVVFTQEANGGAYVCAISNDATCGSYTMTATGVFGIAGLLSGGPTGTFLELQQNFVTGNSPVAACNGLNVTVEWQVHR